MDPFCPVTVLKKTRRGKRKTVCGQKMDIAAVMILRWTWIAWIVNDIVKACIKCAHSDVEVD